MPFKALFKHVIEDRRDSIVEKPVLRRTRNGDRFNLHVELVFQKPIPLYEGEASKPVDVKHLEQLTKKAKSASVALTDLNNHRYRLEINVDSANPSREKELREGLEYLRDVLSAARQPEGFVSVSVYGEPALRAITKFGAPAARAIKALGEPAARVIDEHGERALIQITKTMSSSLFSHQAHSVVSAIEAHGEPALAEIEQHGSGAGFAINSQGKPALKLIQQYGSDAVIAISHKGEDAVTLIEEYGEPAATAIAEHDSLTIQEQAAKKTRSLSAVNAIKKHGLRAAKVLAKIPRIEEKGHYPTDALEAIELGGKRALDLMEKHGADASGAIVEAYRIRKQDQVMPLIEKHGKNAARAIRFFSPHAIKPIQEYGSNAAKAIAEHDVYALDYINKFGAPAAKVIAEHGQTAVDAIKNNQHALRKAQESEPEKVPSLIQKLVKAQKR